jgi:hypothetical protein
MQLVADPACRMAFGVAFGSHRAVGRQVRQHRGEAHTQQHEGSRLPLGIERREPPRMAPLAMMTLPSTGSGAASNFILIPTPERIESGALPFT